LPATEESEDEKRSRKEGEERDDNAEREIFEAVASNAVQVFAIGHVDAEVRTEFRVHGARLHHCSSVL
jgi:hypothetical protein